MKNKKNVPANIIFSDYPDVDVIRVEDTYYMVSTTMHFFPGCPVLRSYNLKDWEIASYVYDILEDTPGQRLDDGHGIYGHGMWAASIRYYNGRFYICFISNDTHKTYLFTSDSVEGPWKKSEISGFYHDMSLLFDDDGKVYTVSGNTEIHLTELKADLSGPVSGGVDKVIISDDREKVILGYEGSHIYKINGKYYIFFIHWPKGTLRSESVFVSDKIEGPYTGRDLVSNDFMNWNSGAAQGGIVDTPDGKWYLILFQDHGALGRMPVLVEITFDKDGWPVFTPDENGQVPLQVSIEDLSPDYKYQPLYCSEFCNADGKLNSPWQWNHIPELKNVAFENGTFSISTSNIVKNVCLAKNTLTQRAFTEHCSASVTVNFSKINEGDYAGLCALEGDYAFIAVTKRDGKYFIVEAERKTPVEPWKIGSVDTEVPAILAEIPVTDDISSIQLKLKLDLSKENQNAVFSWFDKTEENFITLGNPKKLRFTLDMFVGCRFALFNYSEKIAGGTAEFSDFKYVVE